MIILFVITLMTLLALQEEQRRARERQLMDEGRYYEYCESDYSDFISDHGGFISMIIMMIMLIVDDYGLQTGVCGRPRGQRSSSLLPGIWKRSSTFLYPPPSHLPSPSFSSCQFIIIINIIAIVFHRYCCFLC